MKIDYFDNKEEMIKQLFQNTGIHYVINDKITYLQYDENKTKESMDFYFVKTKKEQCKTCKLFITCVNFCNMRQDNYFILHNCKKFKIEEE